MRVFHSKSEARNWLWHQRLAGHSVGLVPTMGALHDGHYSLVRRSVEQCGATIATIFVNPTQFGPGEDLSRYPRTLEADLNGLQTQGADAVFVPNHETMYRSTHSTFVEPPAVAKVLEGGLRPVHFRGVTTVVSKLFHILPATHAYFGQKDFQQAAVITAMAEELDFEIKIEVCPIVRGADGLALSSRNRYLTDQERERALAIPRCLSRAMDLVNAGEIDPKIVEREMFEVLNSGGLDAIDFAVDYAVLVDRETLRPREKIEREQVVALVAARVGTTRLIDNCLFTL